MYQSSLKPKQKQILMANHSKHKQQIEPMRTQSKYIRAGKRVRPSSDWFWLHMIGWVGDFDWAFSCALRFTFMTCN